MNSELESRIEEYMKSNNIGAWDKSKAIRTLIEAGLSISTQTTQVIETEVIERTEKITRKKIIVLENIKAFFPEDLRQLLMFEYDEKNAFLRTKHWISLENWKKITNIVKKHDGEWIRNNDKSHWVLSLT